MALLGSAAMLLWYDIVPEAVAQHDDWHSREHFPERVGIPGFLRAQRWVAETGSPRYFVTYEVSEIGVLSDARYLERLNNPTPWTTRTMQHFRGMTRGFCRVVAGAGTVLGTQALTIRFSPADADRARLETALAQDLLPHLLTRPGLTSAFVFRADAAPPMTAEQQLRGRDRSVDGALLVTGYDATTVAALAREPDLMRRLTACGVAPGAVVDRFSLACLAQPPA